MKKNVNYKKLRDTLFWGEELLNKTHYVIDVNDPENIEIVKDEIWEFIINVELRWLKNRKLLDTDRNILIQLHQQFISLYDDVLEISNRNRANFFQTIAEKTMFPEITTRTQSRDLSKSNAYPNRYEFSFLKRVLGEA